MLTYSLPDIIYNFPEIAHYKEGKHLTYQLSNQANLDVYNMHKEEDIIGKTVSDLKNDVMREEWSKFKNFTDEIQASDLLVLQNKKPLNLDPKIFLNKSGCIVVHSMMKMPVFGKKQNVDGILTLSFNSTNTQNAMWIRELYFHFYNDKTEANRRFMQHIGFEEGINLGLSPRELECLLALLKYRTNKKVSHMLMISPKTLDNHLGKIREKIAGFYNLESLLEMLASKVNWI